MLLYLWMCWCWTKKTPTYRIEIRLAGRGDSEPSYWRVLLYRIRFVIPPTEVLAVKCKYAEMRYWYLSPLPVIVNFKDPDSIMLCMELLYLSVGCAMMVCTDGLQNIVWIPIQ